MAIVYAAYHKPAPLLGGGPVIPVHVGRARAPAPLPGTIGDDTGDSISDRNPAYCELTALYWAWKNDPHPEADRLGLIHYRRLLDLGDDHPSDRAEIWIDRLHVPDWLDRTRAWLDGPGRDVDLVVPRTHVMGRTVERNYASSHDKADFDLARAIVARDHPHMARAFERVAAGYRIRLGNMMVMRREMFGRYCAWLFDILGKIETGDVDRRHYSPTQSRYLGFLAERLFTIFVDHEMAENPGLRVHEVSILNLSRALVSPVVTTDRLNGPEHVNVALSADRAYLPHAAAMLRSLADHADPGRHYTLFFLHSDIPDDALGLLADMLAPQGNLTLEPVNVGQAFARGYRSASRAPSNATYNRFLLFSLLPGLDRLLYLDCDMILRRDVAGLFDTDMGGAPLGGVTDWIMTRTLTGPTPTVEPGIPDLGTYQRDRLGLSRDQIAGYINAGVVLFDFRAMGDTEALGRELVARAMEERYLFRDQDILNARFKGRIAQLDPRWNAFNSSPASYDRVPAPNHARAMAGRADPWIVHYADRAYKPWVAAPVPLAQHYWQALIRTPFYAEVLANLAEAEGTKGPATRKVVHAARRLSERVPVLRAPMLRVYAALGRPGR